MRFKNLLPKTAVSAERCVMNKDTAIYKIHRAKRIEELEEKLKSIEEKNAYWKALPSQDGSYEASITFDGYYKISAKLQELKNE